MRRDEWAIVYALAALAMVPHHRHAGVFEPEGLSLLDSLYFTLYTVTTMGYEDLAPSPEDRLFTTVFILLCATIVIACIIVIGNRVVAAIQHCTAERRKKQIGERARMVMTALSRDTTENGSEKDPRRDLRRTRRP